MVEYLRNNPEKRQELFFGEKQVQESKLNPPSRIIVMILQNLGTIQIDT